MDKENRFDGDGMPSALAQWFAQPDAMLQLATFWPHRLNDWLADSVMQSDTVNRAVWDPEALGVAVLDATGFVVTASPSFVAENAAQSIDLDAVVAAARSKTAIVKPVSLEQNDGRHHSALFAYASIEVAQHWQIPTTMADIKNIRPGAIVLLTTVMSLPQPLPTIRLANCSANCKSPAPKGRTAFPGWVKRLSRKSCCACVRQARWR